MTTPTPIPDSIVIRIAKLFGIDVKQVSRVGGGFSTASVYRAISTGGQTFAVRCTPVASALPEQRLRLLHQMLCRIHADGISEIAAPLTLRMDDEYLLAAGPTSGTEIPTDSQTVLKTAEYLWQAEPWLPGSPAVGVPTDQQTIAAIRCLHRFHESAGQLAAQLPPNEWFCVAVRRSPGVLRRRSIATELSEGLLGQYRVLLHADPDYDFRGLALRACESLDRWLPWLMTRLKALSGHRFSLQPVIRDLWCAHVLFTGDSVTGLIDLSSMSADHVCFDIARLFRSWFGYDTQRVRDSLESFAALRPLSEEERSLFVALDAATVLLSPMTWIRRRLDNQNRSQVLPSICARLEELVRTADGFEPL